MNPVSAMFRSPLRVVFSIALVVVVVAGLIGMNLEHEYKPLKLASNAVAMEPALNPGQRIYIKKDATNIQRGTVVAFTPPSNVAPSIVVLRVIALPGERVTISQGKVTVYNNSHPTGFDPDGSYEPANATTPGSVDLVVPSDDVYLLGITEQTPMIQGFWGQYQRAV